MIAKKRAVYLCARIQRAASGENGIRPNFMLQHLDVLALLVKLIEALVKCLLGLVSGAKLPKAFYEMVMIQTVLQP